MSKTAHTENVNSRTHRLQIVCLQFFTHLQRVVALSTFGAEDTAWFNKAKICVTYLVVCAYSHTESVRHINLTNLRAVNTHTLSTLLHKPSAP